MEGKNTNSKKWILVITAMACSLMELIDTTIVNVSLREISGNIGASVAEIGWVSTAYGIGNVIVIPLSAMLATLFGRKRYYAVSVLVFTIASLMCGISSGLSELILWRFIQGVAGGGLLATSMSIVLGAFPPEEAKTAMLIFVLGVLLGPIFGPVLGGFITDTLSWHWIFFVNVPIGIVCTWLAWTSVSDLEDAKRPPKIDWAGILFVAIALGCLQFVLEEGPLHDWFDSRKICFFFTVSMLGFVAFIWRELTTDYPAVDLKLYKNFNLSMGNIIGLLYGIIANSTLFIFPLLAQQSLGWTATKTGAFMISGGIAGALTMIIGKKLFPDANPKILITSGLILIVVSLIPMGYISPDANETHFFWLFIIRNAGASLLAPNMMSLSVGTLRGKELAQASALSTMTRQLGGALGIAIISIYTTINSATVRYPLVENVTEYNWMVQERLVYLEQSFADAGMSSDGAQLAAHQMLENTVAGQQIFVTYINGFLGMAFLFIFCIPVIFLIKTPKKDKENVAADAH
ncbi:DHA2 family efflux MFS transporter permease subunit [Chitinophaga tropicalis]|uniref:DHA2 family efflux MFS transporter permease subunit n=1 Tax=Chitinophaga tropicalis TaxID=2683588 RepID=A0A7K1U325_9BACT|nr:DHA2 family efflux MFS transporter permease subunit [Chitinophaga tropicalis]MVT08763.1 DHA2 family efflux MFS transporter permease subunit [Chitinophaga tropicalis]